MTTRHLVAVKDDDIDFLAAVSHAWVLFDRMYPNAESRRTMYGSLKRVIRCYTGEVQPVRTFPWHWLVSDIIVESVWLPVRDGYSAKTAKKDAAAIKSILSCYYRAGLLTAEQHRSARALDTRIHRASRTKAGRGLTPEELETVLNSVLAGEQPTKVARDAALLLVMASTGARRTEIAHIRREDVNFKERNVRLCVTKNGAERLAWLHPNAITAIDAWLEHRGRADGPLFHPLTRSCEPLTDRPLSPHQMWKILRYYADSCGVSGLTPHDLRRFAVTTLLDMGHDLALVSRIVGHRQMTTTASYDRRPEARCRDAVDGLPVPAPALLAQ